MRATYCFPTKVESGTSQSKSGTSVHSSNSGNPDELNTSGAASQFWSNVMLAVMVKCDSGDLLHAQVEGLDARHVLLPLPRPYLQLHQPGG